MTWLVTGGAGYIGAHVVRTFLEAGESCVVLDDLSLGLRERVPEGVPLIQADILDAAAVDHALTTHSIEGVVHLAGKKSVPESIRQPELYSRINTGGTQTLLAACSRHGVQHFVFSSTAAVYGIIESAEPVLETVRVDPINPYGQSKLAAEHLLEKATKVAKLNAIVFRYFNVGGAATPELEDLHGENLIPIIRRALAADTSVAVFGTDLPTRDGTCIRDYVHVQDLAVAHLAAARFLRSNSHHRFEVINLGTGIGSTVLEVIDAVSAVEGREVRWHSAPAREGDPVASTCDASLAGKVLDWQPLHTLAQIVARA